MTPSASLPPFETAESHRGFERFIGTSFVLVGALHVLLSVVMLAGTLLSEGEWVGAFLHSVSVGAATQAGFVDVVAVYLSIMNWTGWLAGGYSVFAGRRLLQGEGRDHLRPAAFVNLIYFPMGLTVGILALIGQRRRPLGETA